MCGGILICITPKSRQITEEPNGPILILIIQYERMWDLVSTRSSLTSGEGKGRAFLCFGRLPFIE